MLVTDAEQRSALAVCRGLARGGYRVAAAAVGLPAAAHWSRAVHERLLFPDPRDGASAFVEALREALAAGSYAAVVPATEASLLALSANRDAVEGATAHGLPPHEVVVRSLDKVSLLDAAERAGLAAPESIVCADREEARAAARELGLPVVVKPGRSFVSAGDRLVQQVTTVAADEAAVAQQALRLQPPFVVQRFVRGRPVVSCAGVRADGALRAIVVARYGRTWPPEAGPSCFSRTIEPPPELVERVRGLVELVGWEGIFQVQLLDLGGGAFATVDLNPRPFGSLALAIAAGANLPAVWCDSLLGRFAGPRRTGRAGVSYRWEDAELRHVLRRLRRGSPRAAADVLRPRRRVARAYFEARDPGPLAARALTLLRRRG